MSAPVRIRISARIGGERRHAWAIIYDTREDMIAAADRFNGFAGELAARGEDESLTQAITQAYVDDDGRITVPVMRFHRGRLGTRVLVHEISHAAVAIYGSTLPNDAEVLLDHTCEPLAYLHGDLASSLVDCLYARGILPNPATP